MGKVRERDEEIIKDKAVFEVFDLKGFWKMVGWKTGMFHVKHYNISIINNILNCVTHFVFVY